MTLFLSILYVVGLYSAFLAGSLYFRTQSTPASKSNQYPRKIPVVTLTLVIAIAIPSVLQFFFPAILPTFERDYTQFRAGDWWRLVTPLFVQDGGVAGTMFNLVGLLLVGSIAERMWGSGRWLVIFFTAGILSQGIGFVWQPVGAGNSVGNFGLAASIAVYCLILPALPGVKIASCLTLGAGIILLLLQDIHGAAILLGAIVALVLTRTISQTFKEQL
jgi:membrane associated rhomboid family serine protease